MRNSCITYPEREQMIIIRKSQVDFCGGDTCAAALLSFFEYWHNIKLDMSPKNAAMNKIAELHGDIGYQDESLLQFHSMTELSDGMMGLYGVSSIKNARKLLVSLGIVTEHKNPSNRYKFDHTIYYLFHPEIFSKWLSNRFVKNNESVGKNNDSIIENNDSSVENNGSSVKLSETITETSLEITSETTTEIKEVAVAPTQKPEKQKYSAEEVKGVFDYWQAVMRSGRSILTDDRIKVIKKALGLGYSYDDLKSAIHGCSLTPFYMGDNDQGTKYNGIELILKNAGNIEKFIECSINPPKPAQQNLRQSNNSLSASTGASTGYQPSIFAQILNPDYCENFNSIDSTSQRV